MCTINATIGAPLMLSGTYQKNFEQMQESLLNNIWNSPKAHPNELFKEHVLTQANEFFQAAQQGYGANISDSEFGTSSWQKLVRMERSAFEMAAYKNYAMIKELQHLASLAPNKEAWKLAARDLHNNYALNYQNTETDYFERAASEVARWEEIQANKNEFPFLTHNAIHDERVRASHFYLDDLTLEVDHIFWLKHPLPLAWKCRCYRTLSFSPGTKQIPAKKDLPVVDTFFTQPLKLEGKVFNKKHAYRRAFKNVPITEIITPIKNWPQFRTAKQGAGNYRYNAFINIDDVVSNSKINNEFLKQKKTITFPPSDNTTKHADALIDNIFYEYKEVIAGKEGLIEKNLLKSSIQTNKGNVVIEIHQELNWPVFYAEIQKSNANLNQIYFLYKNKLSKAYQWIDRKSAEYKKLFE